jgi:hypothetical protein
MPDRNPTHKKPVFCDSILAEHNPTTFHRMHSGGQIKIKYQYLITGIAMKTKILLLVHSGETIISLAERRLPKIYFSPSCYC